MEDETSDDSWTEVIDLPSLETEAGRDAAVSFLLDSDLDVEGGRCLAAVLQDGEDMVIRLRYPDGSEEVFDLLVRRSMEVARSTAVEGESN